MAQVEREMTPACIHGFYSPHCIRCDSMGIGAMGTTGKQAQPVRDGHASRCCERCPADRAVCEHCSAEATAYAPLSTLPCPFCGGSATMNSKPEDWGYSSGLVWVSCDACQVSGKRFPTSSWTPATGTVYHDEASKADAIAMWNRRTP